MRKVIPLLMLLVLAPACSADNPGAGWERVHGSRQWWMSTDARIPEDRWIVGGTADEGMILHHDGTTMRTVDPGVEVPLLNWVQRFDDGTVIVVGNRGTTLRFDGTAWSRDDPVTDADLWGVWGSAPDDLWAVGGAEGMAPVILRDTGSGFALVDLPTLQRPGVTVFFKVWGSGPDDVYVVGQHGAVVHWTGTALEELHVGASDDLIGIWGTGPDRIVTVGGRRNGTAAVWDGVSWANPDLTGIPGLNGVWVDGATAHLVGNEGTAIDLDLITLEISRYQIDTPVFLHAINGAPDGSMVTVGGDFATGPAGPYWGEVWVNPAG